MHALAQRKRTPRHSGFTILELIGVMAVISILLAAAIPLTVSVIQTQRLSDERAALPALAEALKRGMLREQAFPVYENNVARNQEGGDDYYWWNLAARHGAGSANEARYPVGSRNNEGNVRKLYFADSSFADFAFSELTGSGSGWLNDFQDPRELRLLLLSTANPDLPLPNTISENEFNNLWDDWAVGSDGDPQVGVWGNYGISSAVWVGRASELVVHRVDLRDWLSEVRIENRRAVKAPNGTQFDSNQSNYPNAGINRYATRVGTNLIDNWDDESVFVYSTNLAGAESQILFTTTTEDTNGNGTLQPNEDLNNNGILDEFTELTALVLSDRGKILDETADATLTVGGNKNGNYEFTTLTLDATSRAPMALIDPLNPNNTQTLSGWSNSDPSIQTRYFLIGQQLLLGEPWNNAEVGAFDINENFKSIRFDGQRWRY
jgi:prepilin-type N-terminal cleavage/methylation domain-containing protein